MFFNTEKIGDNLRKPEKINTSVIPGRADCEDPESSGIIVRIDQNLFTTEPPAVAHQCERRLASRLSTVALAKVEGHRGRLVFWGKIIRSRRRGDAETRGGRQYTPHAIVIPGGAVSKCLGI